MPLNFNSIAINNEERKQNQASAVLEAMYKGAFTIEVMKVTVDDLPRITDVKLEEPIMIGSKNLQNKNLLVNTEQTLADVNMFPVKQEIISAEENDIAYTNALNASFCPCKNEVQDTHAKRHEEKRKYNTQKLRHAELSSPKIPRPPNSFMLFAREHRKGLSKINPTMKNKDISKLLGQAWKSISEAERKAYDKIAQEAAAEHKRRYPAYVYIPKEARIRKAQRDQLKQALKTQRKKLKNLKSQSSSDQENCPPSATSPPSPNLPILLRHTRDCMHRTPGDSPPLLVPCQPKFLAVATSTPLVSSHNEMMHNMGQHCSFEVPSSPFSPANTYRDTNQLRTPLPNFHSLINSGQSNNPQQDNSGFLTRQTPSPDSKSFMWYPGANFYSYSSAAAPWIYPEQHNAHQGLRLPGEMIDEEDIMMMNPHDINQFAVEEQQQEFPAATADDVQVTNSAAGDYKLELLEPTASLATEFKVLESLIQK